MFEFEVTATSGAARTGRITTPRGSITTPCFMPVGTRAAVQTLTSHDLDGLAAEIILGAAMADLCHGCQASAQDKGRLATPAIKHSVILATLSAVALLTIHTE